MKAYISLGDRFSPCVENFDGFLVKQKELSYGEIVEIDATEKRFRVYFDRASMLKKTGSEKNILFFEINRSVHKKTTIFLNFFILEKNKNWKFMKKESTFDKAIINSGVNDMVVYADLLISEININKKSNLISFGCAGGVRNFINTTEEIEVKTEPKGAEISLSGGALIGLSNSEIIVPSQLMKENIFISKDGYISFISTPKSIKGKVIELRKSQ